GQTVSLASAFHDGVVAGTTAVIVRDGTGSYGTATLSSVSGADPEGLPGPNLPGDAVSPGSAPPTPVVRGDNVVYLQGGSLRVYHPANATLVGSVAAPEISILDDLGDAAGPLVIGHIDDTNLRVYDVS